MGTLQEYTKKTKGPFDGKLKLRIWEVTVVVRYELNGEPYSVEQTMALFSDEERAEKFRARYGSRFRKRMWLVDEHGEEE